MITFDQDTYPTGAVRINKFSEPLFEDILMKVLPTIAGIILAGTFATTAHAGPSKSEVMSQCKNEIKNSFEDISRIRTSKFKDRSSGTYVIYRVSFSNADAQKVTCSFKDGIASLTDAKGGMIASKLAANNTDS